MKNTFASIEGLRGWMAWWVVIAHAIQLGGAPDWIPAPVLRLVMRGDSAVNVFIIVSGFVIMHLLLTKREPYGDYLTRRFFRIVPIYYVCLFIAILITGWYREVYIDLPWADDREMRLDRYLATQDNWWTHMVLHMYLLHGLVPDPILKFSTSAFLAPAWSLSLEWQFYLVAPLLIALMLRSQRSMVLTVGALLGMGVVAKALGGGAFQYPAMLLLSIQFFLVGMLSRYALQHLRPLDISPQILFLPVMFAAIYTKSLETVIWAVFLLFAMTEAGLLRVPNAWFRLVMWGAGTNKLIRGLGKVSYSTYLVHIPMFVIVVHFYGRFIPLQAQEDIKWATLLALGAVLIVSPVLYAIVEKPFIALGRRFTRRELPGDRHVVIGAAVGATR